MTYELIRVHQNTGRIDKTLNSGSPAMLMLWALENTTKTKMCLIYEQDTKLIKHIVKGTETFPKVRKDLESKGIYVD